jgi:two-component system response regulator PilR (NtrC family)
MLAEHLLSRIANEYELPSPTISAEAMNALKDYRFPGNVRELENVLERAFTLCEGDNIKADDLSLSPASAKIPTEAVVDRDTGDADKPDEEQAGSGDGMPTSLPESADSLESYLEDIEKNVIIEALEATRWNKTAAAKKLGITFRALRYRLKKLDLE